MTESFAARTGDTMQVLISAILFVYGLLVNLKSHWFCLVCFHSSIARKYVGQLQFMKSDRRPEVYLCCYG